MDLESTILTGMWALWASFSSEIKETILKRLGDKATKVAKDSAQSVWDRVKWDVSAAKYQQALQELYGTIRILGKAEPVSLEGIFTDVVILETPTAFHRYDIKLLRKEPERLETKKWRKAGLGLVKNSANKRIFILGKPGAGKTTFLKFLTVQAAQGNLNKIPIFVSLKEWSDSELALMDYLARQFEICDFPDSKAFVHHILRKGHALVLFDGLDEVNQEGNRRARMINDLRTFTNKYSEAQCLVTCRVAATEYTFDHFVYVELADFDNTQVATFVRKWFKGSRKKRLLFDEGFDKPENWRLRELARVPLLLSLLCLSFDATLEFPQRRVEIYEEALEALLKKWDTSRSIKRDDVYRGLSLGRKRQMFARIAARTFQDGIYFLEQRKLAKEIVSYLLQLPGAESEDIDGDSVLKAIEAQHGIFTERAHRIYSFSHLTFQEYFTAKHIVADTTGRAMSGLLSIENLTDDRWREVILLTASLLDNADEFFKIFTLSLKELTKREPLLVEIFTWAEQKTATFKEGAAAARAYYCYLFLNLIIAPSIARTHRIASDASLSFARDYSNSQVIEICFTLAQRLDRSRSFNQTIAKDTLSAIKLAQENLRDGNIQAVRSVPKELFSTDNSLGTLMIDAFFFVVTIANLQEAIDIHSLTSALRPYFIELRKHATTLADSAPFRVNLPDLSPEIKMALGSRDLIVLPDNAPDYTWANQVEKIHSLIISNSPKRNITEDQSKRISRFFIAARLFMDCLSLSVVSDRQKVEERLLLSPQSLSAIA